MKLMFWRKAARSYVSWINYKNILAVFFLVDSNLTVSYPTVPSTCSVNTFLFKCYYHLMHSRERIASVMTRLQPRSSREIHSGGKKFFLSKTTRLALGPIHPLTQCVISALCTGIKQPRHNAGHSPPSNTKVKNELRYTSTPPICHHGMDRDNCKFYLYEG